MHQLPGGTVTLLFTDIEGSTRLLHETGDTYGEILEAHDRLLREVWDAHRGVEVNTEGDAFFVVFVRAQDAVAGAEAAQRALAAHHWPHGGALAVRMGVHTGTPSVRRGDYWGVDVHYAARLCGAAHGGQVLLSSATRALVPEAAVDDLGEHAVKDFPAPRSLHHLIVDGRRSSDFPPPRTMRGALTNLPTTDSALVGREAELAAVRDRLTASPCRLLTLTGLGGTGKTRLALAAGAELLGTFADGVFLVSLAPVTSADGVPRVIAESIGAPPHADGHESAVIEHLRARNVLLVLDNVEHVLEAAALIGRLLSAAPELHILATSQAPLRLSAESVLVLEPLALPDARERDPKALETAAAVRMFAERARAADAAFALTPANAVAVAELCERLDGLPLALELAAARVRLGGAEGLLRALERGPDALGRGARDLPERQRGIRAALDFTVSLLGDEERRLFAGLGVFADAWTLEEAEAIFGSELDTWEAMATLMDFSLIRQRGDGRLTMTERVRRHARDLLALSDSEAQLRRRHGELMAETVEVLERELLLDLYAVIARTREQLAEIEQALAWARAHDGDLRRRILAAAAWPFWFGALLPAFADEIELLAAADDRDDTVHGRLLTGVAMLHVLRWDMGSATDELSRAAACHRRTGPAAELINTLAIYGHMLAMAHRGPEARAVIEEGLSLAREGLDPRWRDQLEGTIAFNAVFEGNYDEAEDRLRAIMARPERTDFAAKAALSYWGDCALGRGDGAAALQRFAGALRDYLGRDPNNSVLQLIGMAAALAILGQDALAGELVGAIRSACREVGTSELVIFDSELYAEPLRAAAARLGAERWESAQRQGGRRDLAQTCDWALTLTEVTADA